MTIVPSPTVYGGHFLGRLDLSGSGEKEMAGPAISKEEVNEHGIIDSHCSLSL